MSKQQDDKPADYRRGTISQRAETHGPLLRGGKVYGANAAAIVKEISEHLENTIVDKHANQGGGRMLRVRAAEDHGNSLAPSEDMSGFPGDDRPAGPSRQAGKRDRAERKVLAGGTVSKRGSRKA